MAYLKEKLELAIQENELRAEAALARSPKILKYTALVILVLLPLGYFGGKIAGASLWQSKNSAFLPQAVKSFAGALPPKVGQAVLIKNPNGFFTAAVLVTNENLELSLHGGRLNFDFSDASGHVVQSAAQDFFLLPAETKWVVFPRLDSDQDIASVKAQTAQTAGAWQKRYQITKIKLEVSPGQIQSQLSPAAITATGSVTNQSAYQIKTVVLNFILLDTSGNIIGASRRTESDLKPFEKRDYVQTWPGIFLPGSSVKVFAETDVLSAGNITAPDFAAPSSNLDRPSIR